MSQWLIFETQRVILTYWKFLGDTSDREDLSSDDENDLWLPPVTAQKSIRIGKDKISKNDVEVDQNVEENYGNKDPEYADDDEQDNTDAEELQYVDFITAKQQIKWRRKPFTSPVISWETPEEDDDMELLSPVSYFYRYIGPEFFDDVAKFTNIYAQQNNVTFKLCDGPEIAKLFALHVAAGTLKFPRVNLYWVY